MPNPKQKESQTQASQHPQFIPLGKSKIDMASTIHANRSHAKRNSEALNMQIGWMI
jgi:hypothetical protein